MQRIGAGILLIFLMLVSTAVFIQPVGASQASSSQVSFGSIQNLSNMPGVDTAPVVAAVGSYVYVAWVDNPTSSHAVAYFTYSADYGAAGTWNTPPFAFSGMSGGATPQTSAVQIAAEGQYVFLTWEQGAQTAYAISSDNGVDFTGSMGSYGLISIPSTLVGTMSGEAVSACVSTTGDLYAYFTWADILSSTGKKPILFQAYDTNAGRFVATPIALSSTASAHQEDENACSGNHVYVVWDSVYFITNSNNGVGKWSTVKQLRPTGGSGGSLSREPMISASGPNVYVTFPSNINCVGCYQTYIAVSNNYGVTFAPAKPISTGLASTREVQVASSGNSVFVTTRGNETGVGGTQQFVYVSNDAGSTFSLPFLLGKLPNPENGFGGLAIDQATGNVYVQWIHRAVKGGVQQIFLSASQDSGATWSPPQQVSLSTAGTVGYGDPAGGQGPMVAGSSGYAYVVWQDNSSGNGDIYFVAGS